MIISFHILLISLLVIFTDSVSIGGKNYKNDLVPLLSSKIDPFKKDSNSLKIVSNEPFIIQLQVPDKGSNDKDKDRKSKGKDKEKRKRPLGKRFPKLKYWRKKHRIRRETQTPDKKTEVEKKQKSEQHKKHQKDETTKNQATKLSNINHEKEKPKVESQLKNDETRGNGTKEVKNSKNDGGKVKSKTNTPNAQYQQRHRSSSSDVVKMVKPKTESTSSKNSNRELKAERERLEEKIKNLKNLLSAEEVEIPNGVNRNRRKTDSDKVANKIAKMFLTLSAVNGLHDKKKGKCKEEDDDGGPDLWAEERKRNPNRKSYSLNEERFKVKKWIEQIKGKRSSKTCPCMSETQDAENDIFPLERKLAKDYLAYETDQNSEESSENYRDTGSYYYSYRPNKHRSTKSRAYGDSDSRRGLFSKNEKRKVDFLPMEDLEMYRSRARKILQNAEEILDKLREEEEKRRASPTLLLNQLKELTSKIQGEPRYSENDLMKLIQKNLDCLPRQKEKEKEKEKERENDESNPLMDNLRAFFKDPYEKAKALTDESTRQLSQYLLKNLGKLHETTEQPKNAEEENEYGNTPVYYELKPRNKDEITSANLEKSPFNLTESKNILDTNKPESDSVSTAGSAIEDTSNKELEDPMKKRMEEILKEQEEQIKEYTPSPESSENSKDKYDVVKSENVLGENKGTVDSDSTFSETYPEETLKSASELESPKQKVVDGKQSPEEELSQNSDLKKIKNEEETLKNIEKESEPSEKDNVGEATESESMQEKYLGNEDENDVTASKLLPKIDDFAKRDEMTKSQVPEDLGGNKNSEDTIDLPNDSKEYNKLKSNVGRDENDVVAEKKLPDIEDAETTLNNKEDFESKTERANRGSQENQFDQTGEEAKASINDERSENDVIASNLLKNEKDSGTVLEPTESKVISSSDPLIKEQKGGADEESNESKSNENTGQVMEIKLNSKETDTSLPDDTKSEETPDNSKELSNSPNFDVVEENVKEPNESDSGPSEAVVGEEKTQDDIKGDSNSDAILPTDTNNNFENPEENDKNQESESDVVQFPPTNDNEENAEDNAKEPESEDNSVQSPAAEDTDKRPENTVSEDQLKYIQNVIDQRLGEIEEDSDTLEENNQTENLENLENEKKEEDTLRSSEATDKPGDQESEKENVESPLEATNTKDKVAENEESSEIALRSEDDSSKQVKDNLEDSSKEMAGKVEHSIDEMNNEKESGNANEDDESSLKIASPGDDQKAEEEENLDKSEDTNVKVSSKAEGSSDEVPEQVEIQNIDDQVSLRETNDLNNQKAEEKNYSGQDEDENIEASARNEGEVQLTAENQKANDESALKPTNELSDQNENDQNGEDESTIRKANLSEQVGDNLEVESIENLKDGTALKEANADDKRDGVKGNDSDDGRSEESQFGQTQSLNEQGNQGADNETPLKVINDDGEKVESVKEDEENTEDNDAGDENSLKSSKESENENIQKKLDDRSQDEKVEEKSLKSFQSDEQVEAPGENVEENKSGEQMEASDKNAEENKSGEQLEASGENAEENTNGEQVEAPGENVEENTSGEQVEASGKNAEENTSGEQVEASDKNVEENTNGEQVEAFEENVAENKSGEQIEALDENVEENKSDEPVKNSNKSVAENKSDETVRAEYSNYEADNEDNEDDETALTENDPSLQETKSDDPSIDVNDTGELSSETPTSGYGVRQGKDSDLIVENSLQSLDNEPRSQKPSTFEIPKSIEKIIKDLEGGGKEKLSIKTLDPDQIDHFIDRIEEAEQQSKDEDCRKECACADEIDLKSRKRGRYEIVKDFLHWMKDLRINRVLTDD